MREHETQSSKYISFVLYIDILFISLLLICYFMELIFTLHVTFILYVYMSVLFPLSGASYCGHVQ